MMLQFIFSMKHTYNQDIFFIICLNVWIFITRCKDITVFNHTPVCPGASPIMAISSS